MGSRIFITIWYVYFILKADIYNLKTNVGKQQTSSLADTQNLVSAVGMGKGLKGPLTGGPGGPGGPSPGGMMVPPAIRPQAPMSSVSPSGVNPMGKAPSAIKTNIKSANQIHPYGR